MPELRVVGRSIWADNDGISGHVATIDKCWTDYTRKRFAGSIVRACNAHDELVEALNFYMAICGNTANTVDRESADVAWTKGRAAIAKATGAA